MFKKIAVAGFVVITFIIYSLHQRSEGSQAVQRVTSNQSQNTTSQQMNSSASMMSHSPMASYKDGTYTGKSSDAFYGYVQVRATVSGGRLSDITILNYPQDRDNSIAINNDALPQLKQQAIQAQSSEVDGVSGATDTSQAFMESLGDALAQAKA